MRTLYHSFDDDRTEREEIERVIDAIPEEYLHFESREDRSKAIDAVYETLYGLSRPGPDEHDVRDGTIFIDDPSVDDDDPTPWDQADVTSGEDLRERDAQIKPR